jgi:hypothetical protein
MKKHLLWVVAAVVLGMAPAISAAKNAPVEKSGDKSNAGAPPGVALNKCGCYPRGNACVCTKKTAKCECPGECEPVGCDEKRSKEMEKEVAETVKKSQEDEKKREQAETKKQQDEEAKQRQAFEQENKPEGSDDPEAAAPPAETTEKPKKPAKKGTPKK